jgi:hypothetical protein
LFNFFIKYIVKLVPQVIIRQVKKSKFAECSKKHPCDLDPIEYELNCINNKIFKTLNYFKSIHDFKKAANMTSVDFDNDIFENKRFFKA